LLFTKVIVHHVFFGVAKAAKYPTKNILTKGIWLNILFTGGLAIQNVKIILVGYLVFTDFLLQRFILAFLYQTTVVVIWLKYSVYFHFNRTGQV